MQRILEVINWNGSQLIATTEFQAASPSLESAFKINAALFVVAVQTKMNNSPENTLPCVTH
jgi:hypothetical protein